MGAEAFARSPNISWNNWGVEKKMIHHYLFFIGYEFVMLNGNTGQGCSSTLAIFEAETNYSLKQKIDELIIKDAIAYRTKKFNLKSCNLLCCSVIHHWIEGQTTEGPKDHHFVVFSQGVYRSSGENHHHHATTSFSLSVTDDRDLQIKFDDAVEDIINQQKLTLSCEEYSIVSLNVLAHEIQDLQEESGG